MLGPICTDASQKRHNGVAGPIEEVFHQDPEGLGGEDSQRAGRFAVSLAFVEKDVGSGFGDGGIAG